MRRALWSLAAAWIAGCVSPGTWSALHEVERELEREPVVASSGDERIAHARDVRGCAELAQRIVAAHPALGVPRARARAALAMARSEGALPAPELMLELWDFPIGDPQRADREGMYMVGLAQALPPAAALDGRARAAVEDARAALGELAERRREIGAAAAHACVDWSEASAVALRLEGAALVLDRMRDALIARFASSDDALSQIARLDGERARIERMQVDAAARAARGSARLAAWLGGDADVLPGRAPELALAEGTLDHDALLARAIAARGAIESARARARAAAARADAAEADATLPRFVIGANYMQMPSQRAGLGASFGMTLPWLWSGEGAARDAARAAAEAELDGVAGLERDLGAELAAAIGSLDAAERAVRTLRERERPAAQRAMEAVASTYAAGRADLLAWLDAVRTLRELDVEEARLLGEAAHAWAELESAVGGEIARETEGAGTSEDATASDANASEPGTRTSGASTSDDASPDGGAR